MKVALETIEVDDRMRRAIRRHYGKTGLATRREVRDCCSSLLEADLEMIVHDLQEEDHADAD